MKAICPECGKDDMIQKVSAIYSAGVTSGSYTGPTSGQATSQTGLSMQLAPPNKPSAPSTTGGIVIGIILLWIGLAFGTCTLSGTMIKDAPGVLLFCLVVACIGVAILASTNSKAKQHAEKVAAEMPHWEKAMQRWNSLYYCARDDGVFNPKEREFMPVSQMMSYLYD
jgi:hypothetical protein